MLLCVILCYSSQKTFAYLIHFNLSINTVCEFLNLLLIPILLMKILMPKYKTDTALEPRSSDLQSHRHSITLLRRNKEQSFKQETPTKKNFKLLNLTVSTLDVYTYPWLKWVLGYKSLELIFFKSRAWHSICAKENMSKTGHCISPKSYNPRTMVSEPHMQETHLILWHFVPITNFSWPPVK